MSNYIQVEDINQGINFRSDAGSIPEGECVECIGWDLKVPGQLRTNGIFLRCLDVLDYLPNPQDFPRLDDFKLLRLEGRLYGIALAEGFIFVNGIILSDLQKIYSSINVATDGIHIYIVAALSGSPMSYEAFRFEVTPEGLFRLGIEPPDEAPTITAKAQSTKIIVSTESTTGWTTWDCGLFVDGRVFRVDPNVDKGHWKIISPTWAGGDIRDFTVFTDMSEATERDLFTFALLIPHYSSLYSIQIIFGSGAGGEYVYKMPVVGGRALSTFPTVIGGVGKTDIPNLPSRDPYVVTPVVEPPEDPGVPRSPIRSGPVTPLKEAHTTIMEDSSPIPGGGSSFETETLRTVYRDPLETPLSFGQWMFFKIPLEMFTKVGTPVGWHNITKLTFQFDALDASNTSSVYIGDVILAGGGDLTGTYYFMFGWGRDKEGPEIINYSGPARDEGKLIIQGPIEFVRQKVAYGTRPEPIDEQVDCSILYILGGTLTTWWVGGIIDNILTTSGNLNIDETKLHKKMVSLTSNPSRGGGRIVYFKNRLWRFGGSPLSGNLGSNLITFSDISLDGDIMTDAWPQRNGILIGDSSERVIDAAEVNNRLVVITTAGEYAVTVPVVADAGSITITKVSSLGAVGPFVNTGESLVYLSTGGFIQTNGSESKPVDPRYQFLVSPRTTPTPYEGTWKVFEGFFPLHGAFGYDGIGGTEEEIVSRLFLGDYSSGKLCVSAASDMRVLRAQYIPEWNKVLCLVYVEPEGENYYLSMVYEFGVEDINVQGLVAGVDYLPRTINFKSRGYRHPTAKRVVWKRLTFYCDTGYPDNETLLYLRIYVDGIQVGSRTFYGNSGERTEVRYDFGPFVGEFFQFQIYREGYIGDAKIYTPIRIYVDAPGKEK